MCALAQTQPRRDTGQKHLQTFDESPSDQFVQRGSKLDESLLAALGTPGHRDSDLGGSTRQPVQLLLMERMKTTEGDGQRRSGDLPLLSLSHLPLLHLPHPSSE